MSKKIPYMSSKISNTVYKTSYMLNKGLSYDVADIQWITSCKKKSYDHTCNNTLARNRNVIDNVCVSNAFSF